jgi:hypothetical protein
MNSAEKVSSTHHVTGAEGASSSSESLSRVAEEEYDSSITNHAVTFTQLVQAHYRMHNSTIGSELRWSCAHYYPLLKNEFEAANGAIEELHFCRDIDAGAALTDRTRVPWNEKRGGRSGQSTTGDSLPASRELRLPQRRRRHEQISLSI